MPYLIKIGYQEENLSKTTCKGYFIVRTGKTVIIRWGAINAFGLKKKKFFWKSSNLPYELKKKFYSEQRAKNYRSEKINQKIDEGYSKLSSGIKIYKQNLQD